MTIPWCVPISTQCLHAAGAALAFKLRKRKADRGGAAAATAASSKTDFYAALNSAGAYKLPLVLCVDQQRLGDLGAAFGADRRRRRWRRRASPVACTACRWTATT